MEMESPMHPDERNEKMMEIPSYSSEPKMDFETPVLARKGSEFIGEESVSIPSSSETSIQFDDIEHHGTGECPCGTSVFQGSDNDPGCVQKHIDGN